MLDYRITRDLTHNIIIFDKENVISLGKGFGKHKFGAKVKCTNSSQH